MKSKLNLDPKIIDSARSSAARIAQDMQKVYRQTYHCQYRKDCFKASGD